MVALLGVVLLAIAFTDLPICPAAATFGVPCPGCGLTRATVAALHGHPLDALRLHPLVFVITPFFGVVAARGLLAFVRGAGPRPQSRLGRALDRLIGVWALAGTALLIGVWAARFAGYFGGPVPVETFRDWMSSHVEPEVHHVSVPNDVVLPLDR